MQGKSKQPEMSSIFDRQPMNKGQCTTGYHDSERQALAFVGGY